MRTNHILPCGIFQGRVRQRRDTGGEVLNSLDSDRFMGCPLPCGHTVGDFAFPGLDWPELDEIAEYLKGRR